MGDQMTTMPLAPALISYDGDFEVLTLNLPAVLKRYPPQYEPVYRQRGWIMLPGIDRVYVNELVRTQLGWQPRYNFSAVIDRLRDSEQFGSDLARAVGSKGYHDNAVS